MLKRFERVTRKPLAVSIIYLNIILATAIATVPMYRDKICFVGPRYDHHAKHSGYEAFSRYIDSMTQAPVNFRWVPGKSGWALNRAISILSRHKWYSLGAFITELATLQHMLGHRNFLYHILYGDSDLWLLRYAHKIKGHRLLASFHQPPEELKKLKVLKRVVRFLDGVILVSKSQRLYFEQYLPADKIFFVPHGVDTKFFCPGDAVKISPPTCVALGSHLRDFHTLSATVGLIRESNPEVCFTFIGSQRSMNPALRRLEDEKVQFLENISDDKLLWLLQTAHVGIFSLKAATVNNALLETMAVGLPVVATNIGGIGEYVPKDAGILVPAKDPQAMASAIIQLISNPATSVQMGRIGRQHAERLNFRIVAEQMQAVYKRILDNVYEL